MNIPASINLGNLSTISAWFKVAADTGSLQVIAANSAGGNAAGWALFLNTYLTNDHKVIFEARHASSLADVATPAGVFTVGQWYHVAAVVNRTAGTANIYVNGVLQTVSGSVDTDFNNTGGIYIGEQIGNAVTDFNGTIDDVRIYNRALSAQEIWQLYNGT